MSNPPNEPEVPLAGSVARVVRVFGATANLIANVLGNVDRLVNDVTWDSQKLAAESTALYDLVLARAGAVQAAVRSAPRFTRIVKEVARLAALYKLRGPSDALHEEGAARIRDLCLELRGGVLKVGQFASTRMDLLPAPYVKALGTLQDRVPPVDADSIALRVEHELGRPLTEVFATFEREPIAAASLAQVHAATLLDGTQVAVKVQVPGIDETVEVDLAALRLIVTALRDVLPPMDWGTIVGELARSLREELDYEGEGARLAQAALDFAGDPDVIVPHVHGVLSSARLLVMSKIDGERLTDFLDAAEARGDGAARDRVLGTLVRAYCAQVLAHGRFQADAHPGNFLVVPAEGGVKVALLDFGCVQVLPAAVRRGYAQLAGAILTRDAARMAALFQQIGFETRSGDDTALRQFADMILGAFRPGADLATIDPAAQIQEALAIARANPVVKIPQSFVLLGRVFAALGGLLMRYRPKLDLFSTLMPFVAAAMNATDEDAAHTGTAGVIVTAPPA